MNKKKPLLLFFCCFVKMNIIVKLIYLYEILVPDKGGGHWGLGIPEGGGVV